MSISPNRAVALGTPLIFAPLAGAVTALAAKHAPGLDIDPGQLQAIFIAGATIALAKAGLWMKGWQDFEKREQLMPADAFEPANGIDAAGSEPDMDEDIDTAADEDSAVAAGDLDDNIEDDDDDLPAELEPALAAAADEALAAKE